MPAQTFVYVTYIRTTPETLWQALTSPEFSVLLSYTKIALYRWVLASDLPEDPYLADRLVRYFPQALRAFKLHFVQDEVSAAMDDRTRAQILCLVRATERADRSTAAPAPAPPRSSAAR